MKAWVLGCVGLAALSGAALAQETGAEPKADDSLVLASADAITVYATRNPIEAFDYPGQVTVIGKDVIDDFNPSSIADIFDAVPGSNIGGGPRRTGQTPDVRGLSGEGVLVLFDGARQSFLSGHDGRFFVDPDLVQSVEVVRGPNSALYGSGAIGGVIAVRTVTAADLLREGERASVKLGGAFHGVNDEWRVSGTAALRSEDNRFDLVGNITMRDSGDIELGSGLALPADDRNLSSLFKSTFRPNDDLTFSASWIRFGGESVDPNNPQGGNVAGAGNSEVDRNIDSNTVQGALNYAPAGSNLINANLVGYFTSNIVEESEIGASRIVSRKVETIGATLDNRSRISFGSAGDLTFTYGGEFYRDEQTGRDSAALDGTRGGVPDATGKFYGLFAQAELALNSPLGAPGVLTVIPGIRWDKFQNEAPGERSTDDEATSPKVGISYKPIDGLIIFASWAEAFRAPSFNEIYADGVHFRIPNLSVPGPFGPFGPPAFVTNFFISNPDLVAEESQTFEVGAGVDFSDLFFGGDALTAKGSYYRSDVTNLIDLEVNIPFTCFLSPGMAPPFAPPCGSGEAFGNFSRNVNVTNAEIEGVEIEAFYDSDYFYTRANFSTIDGVDAQTGAFVGILSPSTLFIDAGVKWPAADLRVGARALLASEFNEVNDPVEARDAYAVADIYLVWEPADGVLEGLRLDLGVENVGDVDYEVVAAGVSQPGRNFKAAVSWRRAF
ncbi:MAG: TonB-dependent receptor [Parvularculaceae bacterium]